MAPTVAQLKRKAVQAHNAGENWQTFFDSVRDEIRAIEPYNLRRYRKLVLDIHRLWLCGDGKRGCGDWWADDRQQACELSAARRNA
ncbi:unnamed protein product [marine sediment metagenome]|uniref:Uncharacterized protein n=1 Tax=marine sediment metagenome TaxID=412755 RepID=X0SY02_9ZZZZ